MNITRIRTYKAMWMREWRAKRKAEELPDKMLKEGKCPLCFMYLNSDFHQKYPCLSIHEKSALNEGKLFNISNG